MTQKLALLSSYGRADGVWEVKYRLPDGSHETYLRYPIPGGGEGMAGMSIIEQIWTELDMEFDLYMAQPEGKRSDYKKGQMRGMAFTLSLMMIPHFTTVDEIVREVAKRKKMRDTGEAYQTVGLGPRRLEMPADTAPAVKKERKTMPAMSYKVNYRVFTQDEIDNIKKNMVNGMFTAQQIADVFKCPADQVKEICA